MNKILRNTLSVILPIVLVSCATDYKRWPDGGEADRISPEVAGVSIPDGSLNIDRDAEVEIKFSEYIDRNSTRSAISISPQSALKKAKVFWYDKSAGIKFRGLDRDQTVVITVNPSLKDSQGNPLTGSYSMSFSTGRSIDKKSITGKISGAIDKVQIVSLNYSKIRVNLYKVTQDSINYAKEEPEYSAGLSDKFGFDLRNLSSGEYKLVAFNDLNNDSKPQTLTEMISFSPGLCDLLTFDSLYYDLTLGYNDTEPPYIKNSVTAEADVIKIEFSEEIRFNPGTVENIRINDKPEEFEIFADKDDPKIVWLKTKKISQGDRVKLELGAVSDHFGNIINEKFRIKTHTVTDTVKARSFKISSKPPARIPQDGRLNLKTNSFLNDSLSLSFLNLADSTEYAVGKGISRTPYNFTSEIAENNLTGGDYELRIQYADSVVAKQKVAISDEAGWGSISGQIDGSSEDSFVLLFRPVKEGEKTAVQAVSGGYKLKIRPGSYMCAAFEDKFFDGIFGHDINMGKTASAVFFTDTVLVRKNWESADVDFKFLKKQKGR